MDTGPRRRRSEHETVHEKCNTQPMRRTAVFAHTVTG